MVVLAVVWAVALTPMVLRRISDRQFSFGIAHHRRLLHLGASSGSVATSVPGATIGFSVAAQRLYELRGGGQPSPPARDSSGDSASFGPVPNAAPLPAGSTPGPLGASPATAARRRQVVASLVGATVFFFLVGILPAARMLWDMALLTLGCTAAYVALLIHFHRLAVERAQKVMAMRTRHDVTAALQSRRHVIAAQRAAMGDGYEMGEYATGRYPAEAYATGTSYASASEPVLSGSGWSMIGRNSHRVTRR